MNLRGAFIDAKGADVAVKPFDRCRQIAASSEHLHRAIRDAAAHFRGEHLAHRCLQRDILAGIALARGFEDHRARGENFSLTFGDQRLHELKFGDRLAELLALDM